jgi:predicted hydrolase (HD superfamily)
VYEGPEELDVTLDEHIQFIIDALKAKAEDLGLSGEGASG